MSCAGAVGLALAAWCAVALAVFVVAGPVIGRRLRDRQPPDPDRSEDR